MPHILTRYRPNILATLLLVTLALPGVAISGGSPFIPFEQATDSAGAIDVVARYLALDDSTRVDSLTSERLLSAEFGEMITKNNGLPLRFPASFPWRIVSAHALPFEKVPRAIVWVSTDAGTIPGFGPLQLDWFYFVHRTPSGWRIATFERQHLVESVVAQLKQLDTSQAYPESIRPLIIREISTVLFSNEQLRRNFIEHRRAYSELVEQLARLPKLQRIARIDRKASQINTVGVGWGGSAQVVPKQAIDEFLRSATEGEARIFRTELEHQEKLRRIGDDSVQSISRRLGIDHKGLQSLIEGMHALRVSFINTNLPWTKSVLLTIGGEYNYTLGYLYSPTGDIPFISPEEYFYLEELGDGWYIYRAR